MLTPDRHQSTKWLDICRHRMGAIGAHYILILQHHIVPGPRRIVAPLVLAKAAPATPTAPHIRIGSALYRAMLLDMASLPLRQIGEAVASAVSQEDEVTRGLDAIFRGYPVGLPLS